MEVAPPQSWNADATRPSEGGAPPRFTPRPPRAPGQDDRYVPASKMVFDGKRMRGRIQRRTVDYNHTIARWYQVRLVYETILCYELWTMCIKAFGFVATCVATRSSRS